MKTGTKIEVSGISMDWQETWEAARIVRTTARMKPLPEGYHPVRFDADGGVLLVHESNFRIVE